MLRDIYIYAYKKATSDLDPDAKWEGLPFGDEIKQRVREMMKQVWTRRLAEAYRRSTGKELKNPETHLDPRVGYLIGHGANIDPKVLKKLHPDDAYQMAGTWSSMDNITPLMLDDAAKALQRDPRWNTLEHVNGKVRGVRGPVPEITWRPAGKSAFDPEPVRKRNKNFLDWIRMHKHDAEICGLNGEVIKQGEYKEN